MSKDYYVYILASKKYGTLYIGVTNNLTRRVHEHKNDIVHGFTQKYSVHLLVHIERYSSISEAITREKKLKNWRRIWKIELIEDNNPFWKDLSKEWIPDQVRNDRMESVATH